MAETYTRPKMTFKPMMSVNSVPGFLAIVVTIWMLALFSYLMAYKIEGPLDDKVVIIIVQGILNLAIAVFMFYFGSSWGSQRKDETIAQLPAIESSQGCCRGDDHGINPRVPVRKRGENTEE